MNFKKRVNGSWVDTPHYIHNTSTDTLTTLPADIYANDTTATVGLKGQMEQSSTPSPSSPVMPQECGERTGNLLDVANNTVTVGAVTLTNNNGHITISGKTQSEISGSNTVWKNNFAFTLTAGTYYFAGTSGGGVSTSIRLYSDNSTIAGSRASFTLAEDTLVYLGFYIYKNTNNNFTVMLNSGSTALPYEPYGYKIPISSANTTTPVYLGEVESTRRIFKLVLTGQEAWKLQSINSYGIANLWTALPKNYVNQQFGLSSHFTLQTTSIAYTKTEGFYLSSGSVLYIRINATSASTENELKTYLQQQYAAGTPVTVWYVLATPTTATVNEPLRKIGDYADEVSGITIPTITGANTLSIGTTLQPSEVSVTYKGWHPVADVHERENGAWT